MLKRFHFSITQNFLCFTNKVPAKPSHLPTSASYGFDHNRITNPGSFSLKLLIRLVLPMVTLNDGNARSGHYVFRCADREQGKTKLFYYSGFKSSLKMNNNEGVKSHLLMPISRIADDGGPMKMMPSCLHSSANSVFSDRKPYPGWTAFTRNTKS